MPTSEPKEWIDYPARLDGGNQRRVLGGHPPKCIRWALNRGVMTEATRSTAPNVERIVSIETAKGKKRAEA